jgi:DNA polymerase IIIc chi subunit
MTRIDFYSLEPDSGGDRFILTCRLVERIRANGARVLIHCPDPEQAQHLDRLLWTFREDSFLPHGLVGKTDHDLTPVLISGDGTPENEDQVLINLSAEVPDSSAASSVSASPSTMTPRPSRRARAFPLLPRSRLPAGASPDSSLMRTAGDAGSRRRGDLVSAEGEGRRPDRR